ncbi:hypothetical protein TNCV_4072721 [Trichonephila clavipes]|uniref:Uncharacterized protein n=1 Tax=Trichonephila clavipes TaxID=2585209 RepID=A0A8X7BGS5_TRICX|nr:hypothetical protein TNCV_4072721 [Trichonephila clavipes]
MEHRCQLDWRLSGSQHLEKVGSSLCPGKVCPSLLYGLVDSLVNRPIDLMTPDIYCLLLKVSGRAYFCIGAQGLKESLDVPVETLKLFES